MIKYQNTTNKMAVCYDKITNLTLRSKFTNNGLWTHDRFDREVKIQGQKSPTMVRDTSSGGGLPTCQIWKACLERQKKVTARTRFVMDARTSLTLRLKFKVKGHQQWYATHRLEVVYLHANYAKPVLKDKKVTAPTRFVTDARTNERTHILITIGP